MVRYHYRDGVTFDKKKHRWLIILVSLLIIAVAAYVVAIYLAPRLVTVPFTSLTADATYQKIDNSKAGQYGDRLYLPQINVDSPIGQGGDTAALSSGVWQRNTNLGDPVAGGNFALSGAKLTIDLLPWRARAKSPFFNLNDEITVDYKGKRYIYKVDQKNEINTGDSSVEKKGNEARLTLYAVDAKGTPTSGVLVGAKLLNPPTKKEPTSFGGQTEGND
jgi:sortase (surface protein transpeptidase)